MDLMFIYALIFLILSLISYIAEYFLSDYLTKDEEDFSKRRIIKKKVIAWCYSISAIFLAISINLIRIQITS